jgi:hypothetical protein
MAEFPAPTSSFLDVRVADIEALGTLPLGAPPPLIIPSSLPILTQADLEEHEQHSATEPG